ncbi:MAG: hypothetical protein EP343_23015 [Deltaproteobacteria bacterium]|nr:MAG: hypothetical protein EP343_23015 [Deltaproteobacteria bacterium]
MINRLRLRLVRERGSQELRNYFNQGHVVNGLHVKLIQASTAPTRKQALDEVQDWFEEQKSNCRHVYLFRQLQSLMMSVLDEASPVSLRSASQGSLPRSGPSRDIPPRSYSREYRAHTLDSMEIPRGTTRTSMPAMPSASGDRVAPTRSGSFSTELRSARTVTEMPRPSQTLSKGSSFSHSEDTLEQQDLQAWWNSETVTESMKLRLENHPMGAPLRRLLLVPDFFAALLQVLEQTERMPDFKQAREHVEERLQSYCSKLSQPVPFRDLWGLLEPLLKLRRISSASIPAIELPWHRLREIEAEERPTLEKRRKEREEKASQSRENDLWDWDDENSDFKNFATGAVSQIIEASRSSDSLPAARPSDSSIPKAPITSSK